MVLTAFYRCITNICISTAAEPPKPQETAPGSIAQVFAQASLPSSYRAAKDAEEVKLAAERSRAARKKLEARWAAKAHSSKPEDRQSAPPAAARPKPAPHPELAAGKPKPAKAPPVPKKDCPPPNPRTKPEPKPKASRAKVNNSFGSESSSSSGTPQEASSFLENLAAKPFFNGLPKTFSSFGRTQKKPAGPKSREYKHKVKLISELEREEIEKAEKEKKAATRKPSDRRKTEEQKAEAANKRSVAAKEKKIQQIRDEVEKNGTEISEEELNKQVEEFMEKREVRIPNRPLCVMVTDSSYRRNLTNAVLDTYGRNKAMIVLLTIVPTRVNRSSHSKNRSKLPTTKTSPPKRSCEEKLIATTKPL